jgi:HEPN domain-containing protein
MAARAEASLFRAKAEQFLEECRTAAEAGRHDAAMLTAVHAVISAADAVTVALGGRRSADPNHQRAADLLEQIAQDSPELRVRVRQFRELLARKGAVEYESRRATAREARDALKRAERFVDWAREIVARARG